MSLVPTMPALSVSRPYALCAAFGSSVLFACFYDVRVAPVSVDHASWRLFSLAVPAARTTHHSPAHGRTRSAHASHGRPEE